MKKYPEIKKLDIQVPKQFQVFGTGIAIKKENKNVTLKVTNIIEELRKENIIQDLEKKWNVKGE